MADPRNTLPGSFDGFRVWSGNPPTSKLGADGLVFYGANVKDGTGVLWYIVYSIDSAGALTQRMKLGPNAGQGYIDVDNGWLIVTLFRQAGDGQPSDRVPVPGWVRWPDPLARIAALEQRMTELETALGNVAAGPALTLEDEAALDWVKRETKALG